MKFKESYTVQEKVDILSRRLKVTYFVFGAILLIQAGLFFGTQSFADAEFVDKADKVIRTKGIVVVDEQGRDRILIGSPLPASKDRVLSNQEKFEAAFGKWDGKNKWKADYKDLRTTANGMTVIDKDGFDVVAFGENLPGPNGGKRIGKTDGFMLNGDKGRERGGFGVTTMEDGSQQVGLGLDTPKNEGVILAVKDGMTAILINDGENKAAFGNFAPRTWWNYSDKPFSGYLFLDKKYNVTHRINALEESGKTTK